MIRYRMAEVKPKNRSTGYEAHCSNHHPCLVSLLKKGEFRNVPSLVF
jgi:hypothetical protein